MDFPELYRFGREGRWFGMGLFTIYMLDGVMQVRYLDKRLMVVD
jgi:phospholipid-translocating ATPase